MTISSAAVPSSPSLQVSSSRDATTKSEATACLTTDETNANPLLSSWKENPFHLPPFQQIQPSDFQSALEHGMAEHIRELTSIASDQSPPTFANTIATYDRSGSTLDRISTVFSNMCYSCNTDELKEIQTTMTPILSRHRSATYTLPGLFERIEMIHNTLEERTTSENLSLEQRRLVERLYLEFKRQGAAFSTAEKEEYATIKAELASLMTQFAQNVMKDEEEYEIILQKEDFDGCPASLISAARTAATERQKPDNEYLLTLSRGTMEQFLTCSTRRDLRERVWRAWTSRGTLFPSRHNGPIAQRLLTLRLRQAQMHGYPHFAAFQCADTMAGSPEAVTTLLENVWERARSAAERERGILEKYCQSVGEGDVLGEDGIQPWDWRYYAERVRKAEYDFDEAEMRPYLSLEKMTEAVMAVSHKLFGLQYTLRDDLESYHPSVQTYEVRKSTPEDPNKLIALFLHDNFTRKYKSGGAWMSSFRDQTKNLPEGADSMESIPVIANNNNIAKSTPTLLSFDEAETLFHEMGHAHHGMLSDATYGHLAGTNVLQDFVELPSQLMEHWLRQPQVLKEYARHVETGEPIPDDLLERFMKARKFNEGFATVEYTACALLDMALHARDNYDDFDLEEFEAAELKKLGMPQGIIMRHRPAHFLHLFASSSYAAGYYVYLWAEVLDADAFAAFEETGDIFDPDVAKKAQDFIYAAGNTVPPEELFRKFRGRDPDISFMLKKKGLL